MSDPSRRLHPRRPSRRPSRQPSLRVSLRASLGALGLLFACAAACTRPGTEEPGAVPAGDEPPPRACTQIGCSDGLRVELTPDSGMPAGAYTFELEIDGAPTTCTGSLPLAPCEQGPSITCTTDALMVGESGCAMAPADQGFSELIFSGRPAQIKVTVTRDGEVVGSGEFAPEYRRLQPNGPGCEPVCEQAEATLELNALAPS